jgi:hypothetical protein
MPLPYTVSKSKSVEIRGNFEQKSMQRGGGAYEAVAMEYLVRHIRDPWLSGDAGITAAEFQIRRIGNLPRFIASFW